MSPKEQSQNYHGRIDTYLNKNISRYRHNLLTYKPSELGLSTYIQCKVVAPSTEDSNTYRTTVANAITRNVDFFGTWPVQDFRILLLETTDDWNHFLGDTDFKKVKGDQRDQRAGFAIGNTLAFFTRKGIAEETNLLSGGANVDESVEDLATHEAGHMVVEALSPHFNRRKWVKEGAAFALVNKTPYPNWKKELHNYLVEKKYNLAKPDDTFLEKVVYTDSTGRTNHLDRRFGHAYFQFALARCKISPPKLMKQFFDEVNRGGKIETVVSKITKVDEKKLYSEFITSLTQ